MFLERDNVYKIRLTYPYIGNRARINNLFELLEYLYTECSTSYILATTLLLILLFSVIISYFL